MNALKKCKNALKTKIYQKMQNQIFVLNSIIYVKHFKWKKKNLEWSEKNTLVT